MKQVCVVIRVYDRTEDLKYNLEIIRRTWLINNYHIIIVSNGISNGYSLSNEIYANADKVVEINENLGHLKGNSQLLMSGLEFIPQSCEFTILLEADTWIFTDTLIDKYINKIYENNSVWASARWYDRFESNATDFVIVDSKFLLANRNLVDFTVFPECSVTNYLMDHHAKIILINELMPVMLPEYVKKYPYAPTGRFCIFPKGKMVTYHVEDLLKGMDEKKYFFNVVAQEVFFKTKINRNIRFELFKVYLVQFLSYACIRRTWYSKRKRMVL